MTASPEVSDVGTPLPAQPSHPASGRIVGLDVARALALLGMMAAHLVGDAREEHPAWRLVDGHSSGLFCVLAGVAIALMTGRERPLAGRPLLARGLGLVVRAALVVALGLWLARLDHDVMVILPVYGLLFVMALPFVRLGARELGALALAWAVLAPVVTQAARVSLGTGRAPDPGLPGGVRGVIHLLLYPGYPALIWLSLVLAGMALGRLPLARRRVAAWVAGGGAALTTLTLVVSHALTSLPGVRERLLVAWVADLAQVPPSRVRRPVAQDLVDGFDAQLGQPMYGTHPVREPWWEAVIAPHSGTSMTMLHTIGTSALVIGLCLLVVDATARAARGATRVWQVVAGAGAMTLTLYTLHVLMLTPLLPPGEEYRDLVPQWVVVLALGALFGAVGRRGPLEWLAHLAAGLPARLLRRWTDVNAQSTIR